MQIIERRDLLARIERFDPRLLRVIAPAGYGKTILAQQIANRFARSARCDMAGATSALEIAKRLLTGLTPWLGTEGDMILMAATTSDNDLPTWMRFIETAWASNCAGGILIVDNYEMSNENLALREPLNALFLRPHADRTIVVCSREAIPLRSHRFASPPDTMTLRYSELRLTEAEITKLLPKSYSDTNQISEVTAGWPIAVALIVRLIESNEITNIDDLPSRSSFDDLYLYLADHVLDALPKRRRELLTLIASVPQCTIDDLSAIPSADVTRDLADLAPFVIHNSDGTIAVHPLVKSTLEREGSRPNIGIRSAANAALRESRYERAAKLFAVAGDMENCAKSLDAAQMHITAPTPQLLDLTLSLSEEILLRFPMLWCTAIFLSRSLGVDKYDWVAKAERFWASLAPDESLAARGTLFFVLCNGYMNIGAYDRGLAFYEDFVSSISPDEEQALRAPLALARGVLTVPSDRAGDLETLERDAAPILETPATRALWLYDITARFQRVRGERNAERASLATAVELGLELGLPMVICATSLEATFASWFSGDEALSDYYGSILERNVIPSTIRGCRPMLDVLAKRYDDINPSNAKKKSLSYAYMMAAAREFNPEARAHFAQQAIVAADQSQQPFAQIVSRIGLGTLVPGRREALLTEASAIAATTAPVRLRDDTEKVARDQPKGTIFEPLIEHLTSKPKTTSSQKPPKMRLHVLSGWLESDGQQVRLRRRELEICSFLALRRRATSTEGIVAAIWGGEPSATSSVKVHVSRIRKASHNDKIIESLDGGYALSELVTSDVAEIWELIRTLRRERLVEGWEQSKVDALVHWLESVRSALTDPYTNGDWYADSLQNLSIEIRDALIAAARHGMALRRNAEALAIGEHLLSLDRCDETGVEICIRASVNLKDDFGARCYLRTYETHLAEEFGIAVEPYLVGLTNRIEMGGADLPFGSELGRSGLFVSNESA